MIRGTLEHPKFLDLQARLDAPKYRVAGLLECLWHFTAKYAPDGGVGKWSNGAIARALEWDGPADVLIDALCAAGWLDAMEGCRLYVHDWHDHADDAVNRALARAVKHFANGARPRFTRLGEVERLSIESKYDKLGAQSAHVGRMVETHEVRTSGALDASEVRPSPPLPACAPPEPQTPEPQTVAAAPAGAVNGTHRNDLKAKARAIWPECQKAAARHGRRWTALSEARLAIMAARLAEFGPDPAVLVRAIDGAVAYWRLSAPKDADPARHLVPETVYRASTFPKYIEAMEDPKVAPKKYWSQMTLEEQEKMRRDMGMIQ